MGRGPRREQCCGEGYCDEGDELGSEFRLSSANKLDSGARRAEEGFWVAVLPFKYRGSDADLAALADGLTDEVITGLSRFSYLQVIARGSTAKYSASRRGSQRSRNRRM